MVLMSTGRDGHKYGFYMTDSDASRVAMTVGVDGLLNDHGLMSQVVYN